ncbi:MAG: hypothetical protein RMJ88_14015 [Thermogemmata sp.]|nr:hypothetical protein [Thermogemmata sp.]
MKKEPLACSAPAAQFVVERLPSLGYQVTSAEGPHAEKWKDRALPLLDLLGQPNPRGPVEYFRWLGPVKPGGEYVGVAVRIQPNGEVRYHQAWFQNPRKSALRVRFFLVGLVIALVAFGAGIVVDYYIGVIPKLLLSLIAGSDSSNSVANNRSKTPDAGLLHNQGLQGLKKEVTECREVLRRLREFLAQEGFAADPMATVVEERRSVKLISDLDKLHPPKESISFTNVDVKKLLGLLNALNQWADAEIPSHHSQD